MSNRLRLLVALGVALVALGGGAGSAAATSAEVDPAGSITATSNGKLSFEASGLTIACSYTLTGELNALVANVERAGADLGDVTSVTIGDDCTGPVQEAMVASRSMWTRPDNARQAASSSPISGTSRSPGWRRAKPT